MCFHEIIFSLKLRYTKLGIVINEIRMCSQSHNESTQQTEGLKSIGHDKHSLAPTRVKEHRYLFVQPLQVELHHTCLQSLCYNLLHKASTNKQRAKVSILSWSLINTYSGIYACTCVYIFLSCSYLSYS